MTTMFIPLMISFFILSVLGIALVRIAGRRGWLVDRPKKRSLHSEVRIRGGGLLISLLTTMLVLLHDLAGGDSISWELIVPFLIVAAVGFLDDLYSIHPVPRLIAQFIAALAFLGLGDVFSLNSLFIDFDFWVALGFLLSVLWLVWSVNAFNFMDGSDGLAGLQASVGAFGIMFLSGIVSGPDNEILLWLGGSVAATSIGFLLHNWQPSKIFLGDVGSYFLGFFFGAVPFLFLNTQYGRATVVVPLYAAATIWPIYLDSGLTILRRAVKGERIWTPHRTHIYQRLILSGWSHQRVALSYGGISLVNLMTILLEISYPSPDSRYFFSGLIASTILLFLLARRARRVKDAELETEGIESTP